MANLNKCWKIKRSYNLKEIREILKYLGCNKNDIDDCLKPDSMIHDINISSSKLLRVKSTLKS